MRFKTLAALVLLAAAAVPAQAQVASDGLIEPLVVRSEMMQSGDVIPSNTAFQLAWDHTEAGLRYRFWCGPTTATPAQRAIVKNFAETEVTAHTPGSLKATVPAGVLKDGVYNCHMTAYRELAGQVLGESDPSNAITLIIGNTTKPNPPGNLRRILLQLAALEQQRSALLGELIAALAEELPDGNAGTAARK